jgi:hypothetical protein
MPSVLETAPSPEDIRNLRGNRSRAEFGKLIGVTGLTVYRWELPEDSPEHRRPRGKVLERLLEFIASEQAPSVPAPSLPLEPVSAGGAREPLELDEAEAAELASALHHFDQGRLGQAEKEVVRLLSSGVLKSDAACTLAAALLARLQLFSRHDTKGAFATLLGAGAKLALVPRSVQVEYHLSAALLYALSDAELFNPGKAHHHVALGEALLGEGASDRRFLFWYAEFLVASSLYDFALLGRAMERLPVAREFATTPLCRCLAQEAATMPSLSLTNIADATRLVGAYFELAFAGELPLAQLRALVWTAEVRAEQAAPATEILDLIQRAEQVQKRHRIAGGIHAMLMRRNQAEALLRLGDIAGAEAALQEATEIAAELAYTPVRLFTTHTRLHLYTGRLDATRDLARRARASDDVQRDLTRVFGRVLDLICDVYFGEAPADWSQRASEDFATLRRQGIWAIAYRHLVSIAAGIAAQKAQLSDADRLLHIAERALEWSPSATSAALLRRHRAVVLMRRGRFGEARQALEAALATFEASGDTLEAALTRRAVANLDVLEAREGAELRLEQRSHELTRLGVTAPPFVEALELADAPLSRPSRRSSGELAIERLVVPLSRITVRGLGAQAVQHELVQVTRELFPDRRVVLEEVDSTGNATELACSSAALEAPLSWFDFSDGVGRRLRLGISGDLDATKRAALSILVSTAALAFEIAGLRGFTVAPRRGASAGSPPRDDSPLPDFVAASPSMRRLKAELQRLSSSRATIIVTGESGTGKEVVARALHDLSRRASGPYVTFNSAAVPRELFEGQLFGYRKGAFTGATSDHPGVIRAAQGGTLFLDEVGELPLDVQPKLLRFLENGEVLPLGERTPVRVDVRVIAATHRDLLELVRKGRFREDLYYRLQVIPVNIPPLRERREDIVALARFFIQKLTPKGSEPPLLLPDAEAKLIGHAWPGNVRELRNVMERCLAFDPLPPVLTAADLRI